MFFAFTDSLGSGGIFTEPVFVSALLLLGLAHVSGQELFPLVGYGLVVLVVVLVGVADVFESSLGL